MAEVIQYSLRWLTQDDIKAMVAYLRDRPAQTDGPPAVQGVPKAVASSDSIGAHLYNQACAGCHLSDGSGRQSPWAALGGSHTASDPAGTNLIQVLAHGTQVETAQGTMFMDAPSPSVRLVMVTSGTGASTAFAIAEETMADLYS